jgi:hypothetical protein
MNISLDPREWMVAIPDDAAAQHCAHPDWHALRSRLQAGLETWATLEQARGGRSARMFGSFSRRASATLDRVTVHDDLVNQTSSVNRKRGGRIIHDVAGTSTFGGRG